MMQPLSREEKIQLVRGVLQVVGIVVIISCTIALYKVRAQGHECMYQIQEGREIVNEHTGLYGNCTWLNDKAGNIDTTKTTRVYEGDVK